MPLKQRVLLKQTITQALPYSSVPLYKKCYFTLLMFTVAYIVNILFTLSQHQMSLAKTNMTVACNLLYHYRGYVFYEDTLLSK